MKIIIAQQVTVEGDKFPNRWYKEYRSDVVPHQGDYVQDSIWEGDEYYKVIEVIIHYELDECYVTLEKYKTIVPENRKDLYADMANSHEWECSWRFNHEN